MPEPSVQVPVSLIERMRKALLELPPSSRNADIYSELHELSQPTPTAEDGPMPVSLPVSPGDLETSADAVRQVMREHDPGQLNADEVAWLDTAAHRLDKAAELLRETFDRPTGEPPSIADMVPGTTFTARPSGSPRWLTFSRLPGSDPDVEDNEGQRWRWFAIDPSTIRDVTPPTPEGTTR